MNTLKFIAITILGLGLGFGASQVLADTNDVPFDTNPGSTEDTDYGFGCHMDEGEFMEYYIDQFSEEDQAIIEAYIDTLLIEYNVTIEELFDDYELRHELMDEILTFIDEQGLEPVEDYGYGRHHMGW